MMRTLPAVLAVLFLTSLACANAVPAAGRRSLLASQQTNDNQIQCGSGGVCPGNYATFLSSCMNLQCGATAGTVVIRPVASSTSGCGWSNIVLYPSTGACVRWESGGGTPSTTTLDCTTTFRLAIKQGSFSETTCPSLVNLVTSYGLSGTCGVPTNGNAAANQPQWCITPTFGDITVGSSSSICNAATNQPTCTSTTCRPSSPVNCRCVSPSPLPGSTTTCTNNGALDTSANSCDAQDTCDGAGNCVDRVKASTEVCRAKCSTCDDLCDTPEYCPGPDSAVENKKACPADDRKNTGAQCRAQNGECDVADTCTATGTCPDYKANSGTSCNVAGLDTSANSCDAQDTCDGDGNCVDRVKASTEVCRATCQGCDDECDAPENCPGPAAAGATAQQVAASKACPLDDKAGNNDKNCNTVTLTEPTCDAQDKCDSTGVCVDKVKPAGTTCREAKGPCDQPELCPGPMSATSKVCPGEAYVCSVTGSDPNGWTSCTAKPPALQMVAAAAAVPLR